MSESEKTPAKSTAGWHQGVSGTLGALCGLGAIWIPSCQVQFIASAALFAGYCTGHMKGNKQDNERDL